MGRQIGVFETPEDARELHSLLAKKFELLSVPQMHSPSEKPIFAGSYIARKVLFFRKDYLDLVLDNSIYLNGKVQIVPYDGICLEWLNTYESPLGRGKIPGRYYFQGDSTLPESSAFLNKVLSFIVRTVKKTYPLRTDEKYPDYVGPHFLEDAKEGKFDPGWKFVKNKNYQPPRSAK